MHAFKNNILRYLIHASYRSDEEKVEIFDQLKSYFNKAFPLLVEELSNNQNNLLIIEPQSWDMDFEIDFLNKFESKYDPKKLAGFAQSSIGLIVDFIVGKNQGFIPTSSEHYPNLEILKFMGASVIDKKRKIEIINTFEENLNSVVHDIRMLGDTLGKNKQMQFANKELENFFKIFLNFYFARIPIQYIKNMASDALRFNRVPNEMEFAEILFKNAGPGFGKILQQLGKEDGVSGDFQKIFAILESNGKAVPKVILNEILTNDPSGFDLIQFEEKPLGTGTMAQVHKGQLKLKDGNIIDVAIRFLKPNIKNATDHEISILDDFATYFTENFASGYENLPDIKKIVRAIKNFLYLELDIEGTVKRQSKAKEVYSKAYKINVNGEKSTLEFIVPEVYLPPSGKYGSLQIQEFLPGDYKYSEIIDQNQDVAKAISNRMLGLWFEEAMFRSGYFHGDLHQGNFRINIIEDGQRVNVLIYDFGLAREIDSKIQKSFLFIGAGTQMDNAKLIAKGLLDIFEDIEVNEGNLQILEDKLSTAIKESPFKPGDSIERWILWAIKEGYNVNEQLSMLARGGRLVYQLPVLIGEEKAALNYLRTISFKHFVSSLFSSHNHFPLSFFESINISKARFYKSCQDVFRYFKPLNFN